ncbi:MAG TPA: outer membrane protein [Xanthobacteraceae bacterium]|nr:outer membrane protein [Xanthobacteraceae bacterium]
MKTTRAIALCLAAVFGAGLLSPTAKAADLPPYAYKAPEPYSGYGAYSWVGPYVGGTLGYEWGDVSNNPTRPSGVAGGIEGGFNWQHGNFVYGAEADFNLSSADDTFAPWQFSNPWFATVRGRAGVAIGNVLLYGTAGLAFGELTADTAGNLSEHHTGMGWVAGAGAEVGLTPHWSAKAEWLYLDFSDHNFTVTGADNGLAANLVRLGVNYRF